MIYWTYYKNYTEIEIVITLPTRSWVGVGWKSVQTNSTCKVMDPVLEVERKRRQALVLLRQKQVNFTTSEVKTLQYTLYNKLFHRLI